MVGIKESERANNCVFCKSRPRIIHYSHNMWYVQCKGCDKHDPYAYLGSSENAAIEQWNYINRPINRTPTQKRKKDDICD